MPPIKLIALDIDGTLLDDRKQLPPENREVLQEAERRGFLMAIASGRMISRIEAVESLLGVDCIIMAYNGGKIWGRRSEGRPLIVHRTIAAEVGEFFIHYCREQGYPLNFYYQDRLFSEPRPERAALRDLYARRTGAEYEYVDDLLQSFPGIPPTKLIVLAHPQETDPLWAFFRKELDGRIFITKSEPEYLEIMAPGVNKGTALPVLAGHYGIGVEEVLAVGDANNDLDMLLAAGIGVAMANAPDQVKAAARYVTERTNNDAGAAEAVRRWAFNDPAAASASCE